MILYLIFVVAKADELTSLKRALELQYVWDTELEHDIGARMRQLSSPLIGADYLLNATGEGKEPDTDPIVRYDAFDCLTFVEEVYSMSAAEHVAEIDTYRHLLRYGKSAIDYENRHHFMTSQWIPSVLEKGFFSDVTAEFGPTHLVVKDYDEVNWTDFSRKRSYIPLSQYPKGKYNIQVLSIDGVIQSVEQIPEGTLIIVVRQNRNDHPVLITHLGFLVFKDQKPYIRHATKMGEGQVRDDRLPWYFTHLRWIESWPVVGVMLLAPNKVSLDQLKSNQ
jgi:hypothetical protein